MFEVDIYFILFVLIENCLLIYTIFSLLNIKIDYTKFILMLFISVVISYILHNILIPPLFLLLGMYITFIILFICINRISFYLGVVSTSLGFIIYILLHNFILIVLENFKGDKIGEILQGFPSLSSQRFLIFIPQFVIMLFLIILIRHSSFNLKNISDYFEIYRINLLSDRPTDIKKGKKVTSTIYNAIFLLTIQGFFIIILNWNRRIYNLMTSNHMTQYKFPFLVDLVVFSLSLILIWLIYNLIQIFGLYKEEIVNWVKNKQLNEISWEKKMQRHDYNHHLGMVNMMLQMDKCEQAKQYLSGVVGEVENIEQITLSHIDTLNALLYSKVKKARDRGLKLEIEVISHLKEMEVKDWDLNRIIGNLLDNAIEAAEDTKNGKVKLLLEGRKSRNVFSIQTFDVIISKEDQHNIFKKGFTSKREEGHGLGLTICQSLVDKYHGQIKIQVNSKEKITSFIVKLPVKDK